jgi:hypothetical protein
MVGLGLRLAWTGILARSALGLAALTTLAAIAVAFILVRQRGYAAPLHDVPSLASGALAWGAGVLLAFAASVQALRRDRQEGILSLARARGQSDSRYIAGRVGGLAMAVALPVIGGTLVTSVVCLALSTADATVAVVRGSFAALAFAIAFSIVLPAVAMAALGARSRGGGYLALVAVLVVPELLRGLTAQLLPYDWHALTSIPGALSEVRTALMPSGPPDLTMIGRAVVVLGLVTLVALFAVRSSAARVAAEDRA